MFHRRWSSWIKSTATKGGAATDCPSYLNPLNRWLAFAEERQFAARVRCAHNEAYRGPLTCDALSSLRRGLSGLQPRSPFLCEGLLRPSETEFRRWMKLPYASVAVTAWIAAKSDSWTRAQIARRAGNLARNEQSVGRSR